MIDALLHNIKGDYMIWIIGTGTIALEYAKILNQLGHEFIAVGRSGKNADEFIEAGAKEVVSGGLNNYLAASPTTPQKVIVATNVDQLAEVTVSLLNFGIKDILVEKPGFCRPEEITCPHSVNSKLKEVIPPSSLIIFSAANTLE